MSRVRDCDLDAQHVSRSQQIRTTWGLLRKAKLQVRQDPQTPVVVHEIQGLELKKHPHMQPTGSLGEM